MSGTFGPLGPPNSGFAHPFQSPAPGQFVGVPSGAVLLYDSRNVNGTNNSGILDGAVLASWTNLGSGAAAVQAGADGIKPNVDLNILNGEDVVVFEGTDLMTVGSSTTSLAFIHNTGIFDIVVVLRHDATAVQDTILLSTSTSADRGFYWIITAANKFQFAIMKAEPGVPVVSYTTTLSKEAQGVWAKYEVYGDGTNLGISSGMSTFETTAFTSAVGTSSATNVTQIGAGAGTITGAYAWIGIWSRKLSGSEREGLRQYLAGVFGV